METLLYMNVYYKTVQATLEDSVHTNHQELVTLYKPHHRGSVEPTINSLVNSKRSQIPNSLLFSAAYREHLFILGSIDETPQLRQIGYCNLQSGFIVTNVEN